MQILVRSRSDVLCMSPHPCSLCLDDIYLSCTLLFFIFFQDKSTRICLYISLSSYLSYPPTLHLLPTCHTSPAGPISHNSHTRTISPIKLDSSAHLIYAMIAEDLVYTITLLGNSKKTTPRNSCLIVTSRSGNHDDVRQTSSLYKSIDSQDWPRVQCTQPKKGRTTGAYVRSG